MSNQGANESFMTESQAKELMSTAEQIGSDFHELYITHRIRGGLSHEEAMVVLPMGIAGYQMQELKKRQCTLTDIGNLDDSLYAIDSVGQDYERRVQMFVYLVTKEGYDAEHATMRASIPNKMDEDSWSNIS